MASRDVTSQNKAGVVSPGQVENVRRQWAVHEDAVLATQLQGHEFDAKYKRNLAERQLARCDVPLARSVQTSEEVYLQQQQMNEFQRLTDIIQNDAVMAQELQSEEVIRKEQARVRQEQKDQELARELQHKERMRYELRKQEKELRRQRKRLERELQRQADEINNGISGGGELQSTDNVDGQQMDSVQEQTSAAADKRRPRSKSEGKLERPIDSNVAPAANVSPTQGVERQHTQDEELARLLQAQECKGGDGGPDERRRELERQDAELARLLQEEEELRHRRRSAHKSSRHPRQTSDVAQPTTSLLQEGSSSQYRSSSLPQSTSDNVVINANPNYRPLDSPPCDATAAADNAADGDCVGSAQYNRQSSKYTSRPLPATPTSSNPSLDSDPQFPYNASLVHALDQNRDRRPAFQSASVDDDRNTEAAVEQFSERSRQAKRTPGVFNVARRERSCDDLSASDGVKSGKRSDARHESAGRSRRRSASRQRSSQKTDNGSQAAAAAETENVNYETQQHYAFNNNNNTQTCENVFAAIDPTFNRATNSAPRSGGEGTVVGGAGLPADINVSRRRAPLVLDGNYCDLDEIQAGVQDVGINVVPGQRRSRPLSGHGSSNCRQQ